MHMRSALPMLVAASLILPRAAAPQDNLLPPVDSTERLLQFQHFELIQRQDNRWRGDRTQRVVLQFPDGSQMQAKWAKSAPGGEAFNNQPRYELAAYQLQKLFLDEADLVVPPTVARGVPLAWYRQYEPDIPPTFSQTGAVLVVLQYWLTGVTNKDVFDRARIDADSVYARRLGNLNLLTHLINHSDSNLGNVLISANRADPRLFTVDNGVAFSSDRSDRGTAWRVLRTNRLPRAAVERLRQVTREELDRRLGVVAQFVVDEGQLIPTELSAPLSRHVGVRRQDNIVQLGLTESEISGVHRRLRQLLRNVDAGRIQLF